MHRVLIALLLSALPALGLSIPPLVAAQDQAGGSDAPFVGSWSGHSFRLEVSAGGTAFAVYRTYVWCGAQQRFGCDRLIGQRIYAGGLWTATLQAPTATGVVGNIGASSDPSLDGTAVRLVRAPRDLLRLTWGATGHRIQMTLCGPQALASTTACGA